MCEKYKVVIFENFLEILPNDQALLDKKLLVDIIKDLEWEEAKRIAVLEIRKKVHILKLNYDILRNPKLLEEIDTLNYQQYILMDAIESFYFEHLSEFIIEN